MTARPTFALVAGEASGDQLGAALIGSLREACPGASFVGIGGDRMRAAGMDTWWHSEELAVFGLFEVLLHLPRLWRIRQKLHRRLKRLRPDAFIGIDSPDFNLGLEAQLKAAGIRTVHYVSPTVWAWRAGRVRKISRAADLVLCLFPFEPDFYRGHGVAAVYVGHPLADQIPSQAGTAQARQELGLEETGPVVALLPGSRTGETNRMSAPMIEAAARLSAEHTDLAFVAAIANRRAGEIFRDALGKRNSPQVLLVEGRPRTVMAAADVIICASGTATLEAMLINRPIVVVYRLAAPTYHLARLMRLVKSRFIALPNILAGEALVPELIQHQANAVRIARETSRWLQDGHSGHALHARFEAMHRELRRNASHCAARAITNLIGAPS